VISDRIAGAPISWGVCEVPGWGYQLPAERVLAEMRAVGLAATEFGPEGFLPGDAARRRALLDQHRLTAVGGFVPVVLHEPDHDPWPQVKRALNSYIDADILVLAAATGRDDYESRPRLGADGRRRLFRNLDRIRVRAAALGIRACLHPHVGTMIETPGDVAELLEHTGTPLCLDTGHLLIGGGDPAQLARRVPERIAHVHLKDVHAGLAEQVRDGKLTYHEAVRGGLYRPLGEGDADIAGVISALEGNGYQGWYVLEQDTVLDGEPDPGPDAEPDEGAGPLAAVRAGVAYLESLA